MLRTLIQDQTRRMLPVLASLTVAAMALPYWSVRILGNGSRVPAGATEALMPFLVIGPAYAVCALLLGMTAAVSAWSADDVGKHVYALTLPIPRWHYALLRAVAGLVLMLPVCITFWLATLGWASSVEIPPGLRAYPNALALRFAFTAAMSFSVMFWAGSITKRTGRILLGVLVAVTILEVLGSVLGLPWTPLTLVAWLGGKMSLGTMILGRWSLVDV